MRIKHPGRFLIPHPQTPHPTLLAGHARSWGTGCVDIFHGCWGGSSHQGLFTRATLQTPLPASPAPPCPRHGSAACPKCRSDSRGERPTISLCTLNPHQPQMKTSQSFWTGRSDLELWPDSRWLASGEPCTLPEPLFPHSLQGPLASALQGPCTRQSGKCQEQQLAPAD